MLTTRQFSAMAVGMLKCEQYCFHKCRLSLKTCLTAIEDNDICAEKLF